MDRRPMSAYLTCRLCGEPIREIIYWLHGVPYHPRAAECVETIKRETKREASAASVERLCK